MLLLSCNLEVFLSFFFNKISEIKCQQNLLKSESLRNKCTSKDWEDSAQSLFCDFLEISTSTTPRHLQRFWWSSNNEELLRSSSVPSSIKRETDQETNPENERQILSARSSQRGIVGISLARETTDKAEQENDWKLSPPLPSLPPSPIGFGAREDADEEVQIPKPKRETDFHLESIRASNPRSLSEMQRENPRGFERESSWERIRARTVFFFF